LVGCVKWSEKLVPTCINYATLFDNSIEVMPKYNKDYIHTFKNKN